MYDYWQPASFSEASWPPMPAVSLAQGCRRLEALLSRKTTASGARLSCPSDDVPQRALPNWRCASSVACAHCAAKNDSSLDFNLDFCSCVCLFDCVSTAVDELLHLLCSPGRCLPREVRSAPRRRLTPNYPPGSPFRPAALSSALLPWRPVTHTQARTLTSSRRCGGGGKKHKSDF